MVGRTLIVGKYRDRRQYVSVYQTRPRMKRKLMDTTYSVVLRWSPMPERIRHHGSCSLTLLVAAMGPLETL
jgi:hypothetical protein